MSRTTKTQARASVRELRERLRWANAAISDGDGALLREVCGDLYGMTAQLEEFADHLDPEGAQG